MKCDQFVIGVHQSGKQLLIKSTRNDEARARKIRADVHRDRAMHKISGPGQNRTQNNVNPGRGRRGPPGPGQLSWRWDTAEPPAQQGSQGLTRTDATASKLRLSVLVWACKVVHIAPANTRHWLSIDNQVMPSLIRSLWPLIHLPSHSVNPSATYYPVRLPMHSLPRHTWRLRQCQRVRRCRPAQAGVDALGLRAGPRAQWVDLQVGQQLSDNGQIRGWLYCTKSGGPRSPPVPPSISPTNSSSIHYQKNAVGGLAPR